MRTSTACARRSTSTRISASPLACSSPRTSTWPAGSMASASGIRASWAASAAARTELDHTFADELLDFRLGIAELREERARVLPQRRNCLHLWLHVREVERRLQRVDLASRRADLRHAGARRKLRMSPELVHVVETCVGNVRSVEALEHLRGGETRKHALDLGMQRAAIDEPLRSGGKARVLRERLEHGDVERGAFAGTLPAVKRREDRRERVHARRDVRHRDAGFARRIRCARNGEQPGLALDEQVVRLLFRIRPARSVTRNAAPVERGFAFSYRSCTVPYPVCVTG